MVKWIIAILIVLSGILKMRAGAHGAMAILENEKKETFEKNHDEGPGIIDNEFQELGADDSERRAEKIWERAAACFGCGCLIDGIIFILLGRYCG